MFRSLLLACFFIVTVGSYRVQAQSCTDTLIMYYTPEFVEPGASFCIDFKVKNFDCIIALQFKLNWDTASVSYIDANGAELPWVTAASFNIQDHSLSCAWFSISGEAVTVDDGTVIFQLCGMNPDRQNTVLAKFKFPTDSTSLFIDAANCSESACIVLEETPACSDYLRYQPVTRRSLNGYDCRNSTSELETAYLMQNSDGVEIVIDPQDANAIAACIDEDWSIRPLHGPAFRSSPASRQLNTGALGNRINGNVIRDTFCLIPTSAKRNGPGNPTKGSPFHSGGTIEARDSGNSNAPADLALKVFPNPIEGACTVVANSEILELACFDLVGKAMFKAEIRSGSKQYAMSTDNLAPGVYLIRTRTKAGWASKRIIVK